MYKTNPQLDPRPILQTAFASVSVAGIGMERHGSPQTKTPQTQLSHGTFVEQPSPEVCSQSAAKDPAKLGVVSLTRRRCTKPSGHASNLMEQIETGRKLTEEDVQWLDSPMGGWDGASHIQHRK